MMKMFVCALLLFTSLYPTCGRVVEVADDEVVVRVYSGHEYAFYGDDYDVGDTVAMIMNDCGTDVITDDEVVRAQYVIVR